MGLLARAGARWPRAGRQLRGIPWGETSLAQSAGFVSRAVCGDDQSWGGTLRSRHFPRKLTLHGVLATDFLGAWEAGPGERDGLSIGPGCLLARGSTGNYTYVEGARQGRSRLAAAGVGRFVARQVSKDWNRRCTEPHRRPYTHIVIASSHRLGSRPALNERISFAWGRSEQIFHFFLVRSAATPGPSPISANVSPVAPPSRPGRR
jgi:hypothetical protein